jgi:antitoxin ParD1/3/4
MRTNIEIDDTIMQEAMQAGGFKTKKETVEAGLLMLAQRRRAYQKLIDLGGTVDWDDSYDYKAMRADAPQNQ